MRIAPPPGTTVSPLLMDLPDQCIGFHHHTVKSQIIEAFCLFSVNGTPLSVSELSSSSFAENRPAPRET